MKKPFRKISVLIVLFSLFGIQNAASQGYVKLNALYALVGVVNPSVELAEERAEPAESGVSNPAFSFGVSQGCFAGP